MFFKVNFAIHLNFENSSRFRVYNPSLFIPHMLDLLINIFITSFPNLEKCSKISIDYFFNKDNLIFKLCVEKP